jgi:hypothetical protein
MTAFKHGRTFRYDFWWHRPRFKRQHATALPRGRQRRPTTDPRRLGQPKWQAVCREAQFTVISGVVGSVLPARLSSNQTIGQPTPGRRHCGGVRLSAPTGVQEEVVLAVPRGARFVWPTNCDDIDRATCANSCATRPPNTKEGSPQPPRKGIRLIVFRKRVPQMPPSRLYPGRPRAKGAKAQAHV